MEPCFRKAMFSKYHNYHDYECHRVQCIFISVRLCFGTQFYQSNSRCRLKTRYQASRPTAKETGRHVGCQIDGRTDRLMGTEFDKHTYRQAYESTGTGIAALVLASMLPIEQLLKK